MRVMLPFLAGWACAAVEVAAPAAPIRAGEPLEWRIAGAEQAWLTCDVTRTPVLAVTAPDGVETRRAAFLARDHEPGPSGAPVATGEPYLAARHVVRVRGTHRWRLIAPDGAQLAEGAIEAAPATGQRGPLRVSPHNPRLLAWADGSPFVPIGPNVAWAKGPDRLTAFRSYVTALGAAGGNHARVWMSSWCGQIEGEAPDRYRLDQGWLLDGMLAAARAAGVRVTLVLDNHHDAEHGLAFPYGTSQEDRVARFFATPPPPQYERRLAYVLARWGADDAIAAWELFNELDLACPDRARAVAWAVGASALLARLDVDRRLRTVSWAAADWDRLASVGQIDLLQIHAYVQEWVPIDDAVKLPGRDGVGLLAAEAERANRHDRPFVFGEVGFQGSEERNPGNDLDGRGLLLRQQAWAGLLLGGCGSAQAWWWDVHIDRNGLWGVYTGIARAAARIDWRDPGLVPLTPNAGALRVIGWVSPRQALIWAHPRADTWHAHLVEGRPRPRFSRPVPVRLGGFRADTVHIVHQLDMATGEAVARAAATSDAHGELVLQVPSDCAERVLHVEVAR